MAVVQCTVDSEPPAELASAQWQSSGHSATASLAWQQRRAMSRWPAVVPRLRKSRAFRGMRTLHICTARNLLGLVSTTWGSCRQKVSGQEAGGRHKVGSESVRGWGLYKKKLAGLT